MGGMIALASSIFEWVADNLHFIVFNWVSHLVAGLLIAATIYPFLGKTYKKRLNYTLFVAFPAVFASDFPDLLFVISTFIKHRGLEGLRYYLENGGSIHSVFHTDIALVLVIPTTVFFVLLLIYALNWLRQRFSKAKHIKLDKLPSKWLLVVSSISLFCAVVHIIMDMVGF